ncbi:MAG TPA: alcohol dehydrogenase [Lachnospiraceae bacterium]|nr:alcohol dehydrogenase [Lachnospiraceae bacterium]HCG59485.1 alcohol dehydrogenase [Lachnospiraceae bacterium]
MKKLVLSGKRIITGQGSLDVLSEMNCRRACIVTGGQSMIRTHVIERAEKLLEKSGAETMLISGIHKNPDFDEVAAGVRKLQTFHPDMVIAIGGGSAMDAAKGMVLFYEFPELTRENVLEKNRAGAIPASRSVGLVCVPSTSGTGSEVTRGTVLTDRKQKLKVPIMTDCLRPDIAILDPELPMTMPAHIAAETGMDALTHAMESFINHNMDDIDAGLAREAIRGLMKWLPESVHDGTLKAREKVHNYQAMAGISFANVGLGMVHGIAHSFGACFDMAHGLTNAIILPVAMAYNRQDAFAATQLDELSDDCRVEDIVEAVDVLREKLGIPASFREAGITEKDYKNNRKLLLEHAMLGATMVNPVKMTKESMEKMLDRVYYGADDSRIACG